MFKYFSFFCLFYATLSFIVGFNYTMNNGFSLFGIGFVLVWPITVFLLTTAYLKIKDKKEGNNAT